MSQPLLPPWATDAMIEQAIKDLYFEIVAHDMAIDYQVNSRTPTLIAEADAMLKRAAEGW